MKTKEEILKAWKEDNERVKGIYEDASKRGDEHYGRPSWYYNNLKEAEVYYTNLLNNLEKK